MDVEHLSFFQRVRVIFRMIYALLLHYGPREHLPPQTVRNTARWAGPPGSQPPPRTAGPRPELREFRRVIPIAQTQSANGIDVTLFSIDSFREGFIVHGMFSPKYGETDRDNIWHATPVFTLLDDRGNAYQWRGGSGHDNRFESRIQPGLADKAAELTITIGKIHWTFLREQRHVDDEGPWVFKVPLARG